MTQGGFDPPPDEDPAEGIRRWVERLPPSAHTQWLLRHSLPGEQLAAAATQIKFDELKRQREADPHNEQLDNLYEERFWRAVFMDSAHSMSAVGMLAPFIESLFVAIFEGLRKRQRMDAGHARRQRADDQFWNPQIVFRSEGPRDDLVAGIDQLAESCGLKPYLPNDYRKTLSALFAYRNNMLHNGFEWPAETIGKFSSRIASEKWPETWFTSADRDGKPWLYSGSPTLRAGF